MQDIDWMAVLYATAGAVVLTLGYFMFFHINGPPLVVTLEPTEENELIIGTMPLDANYDEAYREFNLEDGIRAVAESELASLPGLQPYTRAQLDKTLKEQDLYYTGTIDADTAIEIGKAVAVNAIITGTIISIFVEDSRREKEACSTDPETKQKSCKPYVEITRKVSTTLALSVIDTTTGRILFGDSYNNSNIIGQTFREGDDGPSVGKIAGEMMRSNMISFVGALSDSLVKRFRWGLFQDIRARGARVEGLKRDIKFGRSDIVYFLINVRKLARGDHFTVKWVDPDGVEREAAEFDWDGSLVDIFEPLFVPEDAEIGKWTLRVWINERLAVEASFMVLTPRQMHSYRLPNQSLKHPAAA